MGWVYAYLGTTVISWVTMITYANKYENYIQKHHYQYKTGTQTRKEAFFTSFSNIVAMMFPGANICLALAYVLYGSDKEFDKLMRKNIKEGKLVPMRIVSRKRERPSSKHTDYSINKPSTVQKNILEEEEDFLDVSRQIALLTKERDEILGYPPKNNRPKQKQKHFQERKY